MAVDFGGYSFLPPSFFVFALNHGRSSRLKRHLICVFRFPDSTTLSSMMSASFALVPFSTNNVGERISLLSFLSPPYKNTEFNVLRRSSEGAPVQASSVNAVLRLTRLRLPFSSLVCTLLQLFSSPERRCLLPNTSTAYISHVVYFPHVEIQLRDIGSIPLKLHRNKSSSTLTVEVRCRRA